MKYLAALFSLLQTLGRLIGLGIAAESARADGAVKAAAQDNDFREREHDAALEATARPDAGTVSDRLQQGRF